MAQPIHDDLNPYMPLYIDNSGEDLINTEGMFDETFETSGGGGTGEGVWGSITGNIEDQTDLIDYVDDISGMVEVKELEEKVDTIETNVTNVTSQMTNVNQQISNVTTQITDVNSQITNLDQELDLKLSKEEYIDTTEQTSGMIETFNVRLDDLQSQLEDSKKFNTEVIVLYDETDTQYEDKDKDYIVKGAVKTVTAIKGNSVTFDEVKISAAPVTLKTAEDITLKNVELTGIVPMKIANAPFDLHADGYITIRDCNLTPESVYNGIDIGNNTGLAKSILIDNVRFDGEFINHGICVYGSADYSMITISNCYFKSVSNVLRLSNRTSSNVVVNLINCQVDEWDERPEYAGLICLHELESSFNNVTINIQNVKTPNGRLVKPDDIASICGTKDENQVIYLYSETEGVLPYSDRYPIINIL